MRYHHQHQRLSNVIRGIFDAPLEYRETVLRVSLSTCVLSKRISDEIIIHLFSSLRFPAGYLFCVDSTSIHWSPAIVSRLFDATCKCQFRFMSMVRKCAPFRTFVERWATHEISSSFESNGPPSSCSRHSEKETENSIRHRCGEPTTVSRVRACASVCLCVHESWKDEEAKSLSRNERMFLPRTKHCVDDKFSQSHTATPLHRWNVQRTNAHMHDWDLLWKTFWVRASLGDLIFLLFVIVVVVFSFSSLQHRHSFLYWFRFVSSKKYYVEFLPVVQRMFFSCCFYINRKTLKSSGISAVLVASS